jgi:hypothetical protein
MEVSVIAQGQGDKFNAFISHDNGIVMLLLKTNLYVEMFLN